MFRLSDLYSDLLRKTMTTDCGLAIEPLDSEVAVLNRQILEERVSFFSINLISSGHVTLLYDGYRIELGKNDLFISAPGKRIYTEEVSDDYKGWCLIAEEEMVYEIPYSRNFIKASYYLANPTSGNKLTLNDDDFRKLLSRVEDLQGYLGGDYLYKSECLYSLFAVFAIDLLNIEKKETQQSELSSVTSELYIRFLRLMHENFIQHHEIDFYADALSVTTIYLSRIVKKISGQTVKNHIDRHLMMEAKYLLAHSDLPVAGIAEKLNFATIAGFCKFFLRHQGCTPKHYRLKEKFQ